MPNESSEDLWQISLKVASAGEMSSGRTERGPRSLNNGELELATPLNIDMALRRTTSGYAHDYAWPLIALVNLFGSSIIKPVVPQAIADDCVEGRMRR